MSEVHVAKSLDSGSLVFWNVCRRLAESATFPEADPFSQSSRALQASAAVTVGACVAGALAAAWVAGAEDAGAAADEDAEWHAARPTAARAVKATARVRRCFMLSLTP